MGPEKDLDMKALSPAKYGKVERVSPEDIFGYKQQCYYLCAGFGYVLYSLANVRNESFIGRTGGVARLCADYRSDLGKGIVLSKGVQRSAVTESGDPHTALVSKRLIVFHAFAYSFYNKLTAIVTCQNDSLGLG